MITLNDKNESVIAGTDVSVAHILRLLQHYSMAYILYEFPQLRQSDISDCLEYAIRCLPKRLNLPKDYDPLSRTQPEQWEQTGE